LLQGDQFGIGVLYGPPPTWISIDVARARPEIRYPGRVPSIDGNGANALDFHIACQAGRFAAGDPEAFFHIVSKDNRFDRFIRHLKTQKIYCLRSSDIADIPTLKAANADGVDQRVGVVVDTLRRRKAALPRTLKTLTRAIHAIFGSPLDELEIEASVYALRERAIVAVAAAKVTCALPEYDEPDCSGRSSLAI
jgi:PIN domain